MSFSHLDSRVIYRAQLRTACAAIDGDVTHALASAPSTSTDDELCLHWAQLVKLLLEAHALEPVFAVKECPVCRETGLLPDHERRARMLDILADALVVARESQSSAIMIERIWHAVGYASASAAG